jgi:adenylate cyclase
MRLILLLYLLLMSHVSMTAQWTLQSIDSAIQLLLENPVLDPGEDSMLCDSLTGFCKAENLSCQLVLLHAFRATIYSQETKYAQAIEKLLEARRTLDSTSCSDQTKVNLLWANSHVYMEMNDFGKADSFAIMAMRMYKNDWKDKLLLIRLHRDYGSRADDLNIAIDHLDTAYQLAKTIDNPLLAIQILINTGSVYAMNDSFRLARQYLIRAMDQTRQSRLDTQRVNNFMMVLYNNLAGLSEDNRETVQLLDSAIHYAVLQKDIKAEQTLTENQAYLYSEMGDYKNGYEALWVAMTLKDTVMSIEKYRAITDMQEKYEAEKRTTEIQALKLENLDAELKQLRFKRARNQMLAGGSLMMGLALLFGYGFLAIRKSRRLIAIEKDRSEHLLLNILPADIAEELKAQGKAAARNHERVAILFTDFKEFTQISDKMSAADLVEELNTCFRAFDRICKKYDIEKIKTIGDAYMAVAGLHDSGTGPIRNSVMAALEIQAFVNQRKKERDALGLSAFEMRLGIHTGPVVSGIVGESKFQYDIWGDTVNTANRMESSGEVGKVNISESTYHIVRDDPDFIFESRGLIAAKGKGDVPMWFVHLAPDHSVPDVS